MKLKHIYLPTYKEIYMKKFFFYLIVSLLVVWSGVLAQPKFSGLFFGDYYYMANNHVGNQKTMQAFDYRRIYLTTDYAIAEDVMARFRMESDPGASSLGAGNNTGKLSTMVKDAWFQINKVTDGGSMIIGLQGTPNINMAEGIFSYRPLEKTIQDLHGISASRDMGVSFNQKFSDQFIGGLLLGNNSGNGVWTNKYKAAYLYVQYNPMKELTVLVDGQYNGVAMSSFNRTGDVIVNYANSSFSLGAQYFLNGKNAAPGSPTIKQNGISLNGWAALSDNLHLVARYDNYTPDVDHKNTSIGTSTQSFILGGLDWSIKKNVHFMPNVEYTSYASYTTAGVSTSPDPDVLTRVTFYISF